MTPSLRAPRAPSLAVVDDLVASGDDEPPPGALVGPVLATVTLISDSRWWSEEVMAYLGTEGFAVLVDPVGESAFDHRSRAADAVIIDLRLTARSALAVCVAWRRRSSVPIVAIVPRDEDAVIAAFTAGADQVLVEDTTNRQLVAHLRATLRRFPARRAVVDPVPVDAPVQLGGDGHSAVVGGRAVPLSEEEFGILSLLLDRPGRVVTRRDLASMLVYASGSTRAVDFAVRRLREKLEGVDGRRRIVVVRGVGFRFDLAGEDRG